MATTNHSAPSEADFARLEGELFTRIDRHHRRQVLRHRLVTAAAVVVLAGAGLAAGTVANPAQESRFAYCYEGASTASAFSSTVLAESSATNKSLRPSSAKVTQAVDLCAGLWRAGVIGSTSSRASGGPAVTGRVPKLQACLRNDLTIAVFPRADVSASVSAFCENLGMSAP